MSKSQEILSNTFDALTKYERKGDDIANGILEAVRTGRINTIEKFDAMVYATYDAKGWNYKPGRPAPGVEIIKVPQLIRVYVSTVRAAFQLDVSVMSAESMYELRQELQRRRHEPGHATARTNGVDGDLQTAFAIEGVRISRPDELIGEPVHDLAVVYAHLENGERALLNKSLDRLINRYRPTIEPKLSAAA